MLGIIFLLFGADATHYAHYVFNTLKQNSSGQISFEVRSGQAPELTQIFTGMTTYHELIMWCLDTQLSSACGMSSCWVVDGVLFICVFGNGIFYILLGCFLLFQEFLAILSKVSRGTIQEKMQWIFGLYDLNGDGLITKNEMLDVVSSIYEMLGHHTEPQVEENSASDHVDKIFHVSW